MKPDQLIAHALGVAQTTQPWAVPYSAGVREASGDGNLNDLNSTPPAVPHILGTHTALHAMKSVGKIAAVYEARDHSDNWTQDPLPGRAEIRKMAADLVTAAIRLANLEGFHLGEALIERVREKNGRGFSDGEP